MRLFSALIIGFGILVATVSVITGPTDADHAAATPRHVILAMSGPESDGPLDGFRFDAQIQLADAAPAYTDTLIFDRGLFLTGENTDRCNHPPSVYHAAKSADGLAFVVRAECPTKNTSMVWRGIIQGDTVTGTITWTSSRWYWDTEQVLDFTGTLTAHPTLMAMAG